MTGPSVCLCGWMREGMADGGCRFNYFLVSAPSALSCPYSLQRRVWFALFVVAVFIPVFPDLWGFFLTCPFFVSSPSSSSTAFFF